MEYAGLPKEEHDRVFRLYSDQAKSFRRSLSILLISSGIVFAFFVVPFLGFSAQLAAAKIDAARVEQDRLRAEERLAQLQPEIEAMKGIGNLLHRHGEKTVAIKTYRVWAEEGRNRRRFILAKRDEYSAHQDDDLREWANGIQATLSPDVFSRVRYVNMGVGNKCEWRLNKDRESLTDYVACRACEAFRDLDAMILRRFSRISVDWSVEKSDPSDLTAIADRACGFLLNGETHWRHPTPRPPDANRLRGYLTHDMRAYRQTVDVLRSQVRGHMARTSEKTASLVAELDRARAIEAGLLNELEQLSRFDRLATPFGDVPINLNQLALVFPIAVALGFLMVATSFGQMIRLRIEFRKLSSQFDTEGQVISQSYMDTVAPVWLSLKEGAMTCGLKWCVLLAPLGLILMTYALMLQSKTFAAASPEGSAISSNVYYVLYAVTLVLVLGGLVHIWRSARLVNAE